MTSSSSALGKALLFVLLGTACLREHPALAQDAQPKQKRPPDLTKLRVLLVIDSTSNLEKSVKKDQSTMVTTLCRGIPEDLFDLTVLAGNDATPAKILAHYRALKTDDTEALLCYYAGHGATDPTRGHFLGMEAGVLFRADVLKAMQARKPGLVILLTDCCSNLVPAPAKVTFPYYATEKLLPNYRCLFFQHRGVVDITASTGDAAYGDDKRGGSFTWTFGNSMVTPAAKLDADGDGFLTWTEFFTVVQRDTQRLQKNQKPRAWSLGK